jgi:hypothetical protein
LFRNEPHDVLRDVPEKLSSSTYRFNLDILIFSRVGTEPQRYLITFLLELEF